MRIFKISLLSLAIAATVACSKDDDDDGGGTTNHEGNITATWQLQQFEQLETSEIAGNTIWETATEGDNFNGSITFDNNYTYTSDLQMDMTIRSGVPGGPSDTNTITQISILNSVGAWEIRNNEELVIYNTDTVVLDIVSSTSNKLVLNAFEQTQDSISTTTQANLVFVR